MRTTFTFFKKSSEKISKWGTLLVLFLFFSFSAFAQQNIAPSATVSASNCVGGCGTLNDLDFGVCGSRQVYISTSNPPSTVVGTDYIQWDFSSIRTFDSLIIHHGSTTGYFLSGATVQYWDGSTWITNSVFDSLPEQCISRVGIGKITAKRFRITLFTMTGLGYQALPFFREIEVLEAPIGKNNAGVLKIDSPIVFCGGFEDVYATIANSGTNQIDSVNVLWEVNGVAQSPVQYKTKLDTIGGTAPSTVTLKLGSYNFQTTAAIKVYTDMPNGVIDTLNGNDTLVKSISPALFGNYTVNPSLPPFTTNNFLSLQAMTNALSNYGICSNTTITISNGTYNEALELSNILGLDSNVTLTIDGKDSSKTILSQGTSFATVLFDEVQYVTVKNLTIKYTGNYGDAVMFYKADHNTLSNCYTWVDPTSTSSLHNNIVFSGSKTSNGNNAEGNYNVVSNNRVIGGYYGVFMNGSQTSPPSNNQILNNLLDSVYYYGIYMNYVDMTDVVGNSVDMLTRGNSNSWGIRAYYAKNIHMNANDVMAGAYGIYWYNYNYNPPQIRRNELINNMVYSSGNYAVYMYYTDSVDVLFNSIYGGNSSTSSYAMMIGGNSASPLSGFDVRNNIFYATDGYSLSTNMPDTMFQKFNYNVFYSGGSNLMRIANTAYSSLTAYQTASPLFNTKSLQGDPAFISPYNLHLVGTLANDVGDNGTPVTTDIDGDTRPIGTSTIVDIGADEYDIPNCPPPMNVKDSAGTYMAKVTFTPNLISHLIEIELTTCGGQQGSGTIDSVYTDSIIFTNLSSSTCYTFYIREHCSRGQVSVWRGPYNFNTTLPAPTGVNCVSGTASLLYQEDFEGDPVSNGWSPLDNGWTGDIGLAQAQGYWNVGIPGRDGFPGSGPSYAHSGSNWMYSMVVNNYNNDFKMVTPMIDLSQVKDSAEFSFWLHGYGVGLGTITIGASTSQTGPFTPIFVWEAEGKQLVTTAAGAYYQVGVRLDSLVGQKVFLEYDVDPFGTAYQGQFGIDLVEARGCVTCNTPDSLKIYNTQAGGVELDWHEKGSATSWEVSYDSTVGSLPNQGTQLVASSNPFVITGLNPGTIYYYYVRSICGSGDTSGWYGPIRKEVAYPMPFFEDLETFGAMTRDKSKYPWPNGWSSNSTFQLSANAQNYWWSGRIGSGPTVDHTLGTSSGIYVYTNRSGSTNDSSFFMSPDIYVDSSSASIELSYWYHMYGTNIVSLEVWIESNGQRTLIDTLLGQQQAAQSDPWLQSTVALSGYQGKTVKIIFKGTRGGYPPGIVALDDISLDVRSASDISPTAIISPDGCVSIGSQGVDVEVTNVGSDTIHGFDITYILNGGTAVTESDITILAPAASVTHTFVTNANFPSAGSYDLMVYTTSAADTLNQNDTIKANYNIIGIPDTLDFEGIAAQAGPTTFANGWTASGNGSGNFQWNTRKGNTPSDSTGPEFDNTLRTATGTYIYTEASSPSVQGDTAFLTSNCYDLSAATNILTLKYWYHMYGKNIQGLTVQLDSAGTWVTIDTLVGQQQTAITDTFKMQAINLNAYAGLSTTSIRFVVERGADYAGDVSIDDIVFNDKPVFVGVEEQQLEINDFALYPNPSNGSFKLMLNTATESNFDVSIRDLQGKVVYTEQIAVNGNFSKDYKLESLAKGVYFINLKNEETSIVRKLIIQ